MKDALLVYRDGCIKFITLREAVPVLQLQDRTRLDVLRPEKADLPKVTLFQLRANTEPYFIYEERP